MIDLLQDVRYAFRSARKTPGHTAAFVAVLGLGIGCATAMFTVVNGVLLHPLPFPQADRLVQVGAFEPPDGDYIRTWSRNHSLEGLALFQPGGVNLGSSGRVERVYAAVVTAGFFPLLSVQAAIGRAFTKEEEQAAAPHVAVLSHHLWTSRFEGDLGILGRDIDLNGVPHQVIGVMPRGFEFPEHTGVWVAGGARGRLDLGSDRPADLPASLRYTVMIGRLRDGVSLEQANQDHKALFEQLRREGQRTGSTQRVFSLQDRLVGNVRTPLLILFAAVLFVLLIGCTNAANLLLARAAGRRREIAIRACMGAGSGRILRQLLTETLFLTLAGGLAGVMLAVICLRAIRAVAPANIPRLAAAEIDGRVLAFTLLVSLIAGILAGLAPALQLFAPDLGRALKDQQGGITASRMGRRMRGLLVAGEIALALVLVEGASLAIQSLWRLSEVRTGLDPRNVLTAELGVPRAKYRTALELADFDRRLLEEAAHIPGVVAAGAVSTLPFGGKGGGYLFVKGLPGTQRVLVIAGDYFRAMGIPLLAGRAFTAADHHGSQPVILINQELARQLWSGENPIGRQMQVMGGSEAGPREVVGVVGNVRSQRLQSDGPVDPPEPEFYIPELQPWRQAPEQMTMVLRTAADPGAAVPALRRVVASLDRELPLFLVRTMTEVMSESIAPPRFRAALLGAFAFLAFALAVLGVYGVVTYATACRTQEIGLRMSLGARPWDVVRLVMGQGLRMALAGAGAGVAIALWLTHLMSSLLYGVSAADPLTYVAAAVVLIGAVVAASVVPAVRASRIDPVSALKYE